MEMKHQVSRRSIIRMAGVAGLAVGAPGLAGAKSDKLSFKNKDFYKKDGEFDEEAGKDAYIEMMKFHDYPIFEGLREKLWVSDYGIGEFATLGLGANMFVNNETDRYMLMDLFLLPNQMLPEHYHLKTENNPAKLEGWLVRHGMSYIVGEGEETEGIKDKIPENQKKWATVFHAVETTPGGFVQLNRATARHWQLAGPEGAIITEVATVHDDSGVRHSNTDLVFP